MERSFPSMIYEIHLYKNIRHTLFLGYVDKRSECPLKLPKVYFCFLKRGFCAEMWWKDTNTKKGIHIKTLKDTHEKMSHRWGISLI